MTRIALTLAFLMALGSSASAEQSVAIVGGRVHVDSGTVIEGGTVLIEGGKITAVGAKISIPTNARRIDAAGKVVTAGFIDASTRLGLVEVSLVPATNEGRFANGKDSVHAAYRVSDGYNANSISIPLARTGGVTAVVSTPGGGLVAGRSALFSLRDGTTATVTLADDLAMHATLGEQALASAEGSRGIAVEKLRELLDDARDYSRNKQRFNRNQARDYAAGRLDLEALGALLRNQMPLVVRANRSSDLLAAIRLGKEFGIRVVIEGGVEAWKVADELAAAKVPVLLDPVSNLPRSFDRIYVRDDAAARLAAKGVTIAISGLGDASNVRNLRHRTGIAIANGLSWNAALAAVTTGPATVFGVDKRGALRKGYAGDVVVWTGDPFELWTRPLVMLIAGKEQSLRTRQTQLFERYRVLPKKRTAR